MPNWMEGTLRLRGRTEDILRFFREGINVYVYDYKVDNEHPSGVFVPAARDIWYSEAEFRDSYEIYMRTQAYIEGTTRGFLSPQEILLLKHPGVMTIAVFAKQAWRFNAKEFEEISKKFNIDIRGFGGDIGMAICQNFIVVNGKTKSDELSAYDDWFWDSPLPLNGG